MKIARDENGRELIASPDAPKQAVCPYCGGEVTLRGRKRMGTSEKSWFWRHRDNNRTQCTIRKNIARL